MHEDSKDTHFNLYGSNDGTNWQRLTSLRRWMPHFEPRREEIIEGFPDQTVRYVKLEQRAPSPGVPMKIYELNFFSARLNQIYTKAARMRTQPPVSNPSTQKVPAEQFVQLDQVIDLSASLREDGTLNCELPTGDWTILRFGHTTNGNEIHPASKRAGGLETDKFSKEALYHHFDQG